MSTGTNLEKFKSFEMRNKVFELELEGVFFWKLIRGRIYNNILKNLSLLDESSFTVPQSRREKVAGFFKYLALATRNIFSPPGRVDILIVNHPRKIKGAQGFHDPNTTWLIEELKGRGEDYLVLDMPLNWSSHPMTLSPNMRPIENLTLIPKVFYKYFAPNPLKGNELLSRLSRELIELFGSDGNLHKEAFDQIRIFQIEYRYYLKLLKKIKPKKLWVVIAYAHHALIAAAQSLGIESEEIQHSLISKDHINYSFGGLREVPYFPDRLCLFGHFWYENSEIPLSEDKIDYYQHDIRRYQAPIRGDKPNKKILFLTQAIITKYIVSFVEEMLESGLFSDYEISIKLHPSEFLVWRSESPELVELQERGKLRIIDSFDPPLYELFKEHDTVVAVASTSSFEALYFGCSVYLLKVGPINWISELKSIFPHTIEQASELIELIHSAREIEPPLGELFYSQSS